MGFDVEACDLNPKRFKLTKIECRKIDLNEDLPYHISSFDLVTYIEIIEHLRNPCIQSPSLKGFSGKKES